MVLVFRPPTAGVFIHFYESAFSVLQEVGAM